MCIPQAAPPPPPQSAQALPLGDGLAQRARLAINARKGRVDAAVESKQ